VPAKRDVEQFSVHKLEAFEDAFASWSEALKAAKIFVHLAANVGSGISLQIQEGWFAPPELEESTFEVEF
jgi:hypothetical protein